MTDKEMRFSLSVILDALFCVLAEDQNPRAVLILPHSSRLGSPGLVQVTQQAYGPAEILAELEI
jgi:hypothetical protein